MTSVATLCAGPAGLMFTARALRRQGHFARSAPPSPIPLDRHGAPGWALPAAGIKLIA